MLKNELRYSTKSKLKQKTYSKTYSIANDRENERIMACKVK